LGGSIAQGLNPKESVVINDSHYQLTEHGRQPDHGLGQPNPLTTDEVVRRGQEAMERKRRSYEDWLLIAEALQVGRTEVMRTIHTNKPAGGRYEKAMAEWLFARSFHLINKCTRSHLLQCLQHRADIEKWRASLTEAERFSFNDPTTVLRKWKAKTVVPDPNAPLETSAFAKLKETNIELQEGLHRAEREIARGGGDLWTLDDTDEDIIRVLSEKFPANRAERIARKWLKKLTGNNAGDKRSKTPASQVGVRI
jgi:hypothetical protein